MGNSVSSATPAGPPRVLCILNQSEVRGRVRQALERAGFVVSEAATGLDGVAAAERGAPDLVLVDFHLPDIEGTAVATHLRKSLSSMPIVALAEPGHEHKLAISAGCNGVVDAPADYERLPAHLREFLAGKKEKLRSVEEAKLLKEYSTSLVTTLETKVNELTVANSRLKAIDRFKTEFLQSIAHELASPLTPIAGYLKILQSQRLGELSARQAQVVEAMLQSAERLSRTIDNLADFAALETGEYRLQAADIDPVKILFDAIAQKHALARQKRIQVRTIGLRQGELTVRVDSRRLQQAMGNLVENAIKYSPAGSDVLVETIRTSAGLRFCVYDQGAGVPREEQQAIFEPFHHIERAGSGEVGGAGLGLAVARKIVEAHSGGIGVESPPKNQPEHGRHFAGSKFWFEIAALAPNSDVVPNANS